MSLHHIANIKGAKGDPGTPGPFIILSSGSSFGSDLDNLTTTGVYFLNFALANVQNLPPSFSTNWLARIEVVDLGGGGRCWQRLEGIGGGTTIKTQAARYRANEAAGFQEWQNIIGGIGGGGSLTAIPRHRAVGRLPARRSLVGVAA